MKRERGMGSARQPFLVLVLVGDASDFAKIVDVCAGHNIGKHARATRCSVFTLRRVHDIH